MRFLFEHHGAGSFGFPIRFALAVALTVCAARTGRARLLPVAVILALPIIGASSVLTVLAAIPRLPTRDQGPRRSMQASSTQSGPVTATASPVSPLSARSALSAGSAQT